MPTQGLFLVTLLYLIHRWVLSILFRSETVEPPRHDDGDRDESLIHRTVHITETLQGKATDVIFHYVESLNRNRNCVVFLHGFTDTWKLWKAVFPVLAKDYHVVAFDLKGCGQSSMAYPIGLFREIHDLGGNYSFPMQADEIVAALEKIGIRQFSLVTLDLGTIIGDVLAGNYCDRIIHYVRCQQPLVGHFRGSIPQGQLLRRKRSARWLTALLESDPSSLLRVIYGRTGWPMLDQNIKRSLYSMSDKALDSAIDEVSYVFQHGPRDGKPGTFTCAWAGLYQHNQDYKQYIQNNLDAYRRYAFPITLFQGVHDIAMPSTRFDGSTGMAFRVVRSLSGKTILRSRPFDQNGKGLGNGYKPWGDFLPDCDRPMAASEFFPRSPAVTLKFFDTGHFIPLESPDLFTQSLVKALAS